MSEKKAEAILLSWLERGARNSTGKSILCKIYDLVGNRKAGGGSGARRIQHMQRPRLSCKMKILQ
jgi:hypothetical protein